MMASAPERLQTALIKADRRAFVKAAVIAGMTSHEVGQAWKGNPVSALAFMRLCALCGIDAATGAPVSDAPFPQRIAWPGLGLTFTQWRSQNGKSLSDAASKSRLGTSTLSVAGQGQPINTESFLAVCTLIGRRPETFLSFTRSDVSRETATRKNGEECQPEARS